MKSIFGALLLGIIFSAVGYCVAFLWGKPIVDTAKESLEWPQAAGVVQESKIDKDIKDGKTNYSPHVVYKYTVDNQEFIGNRITALGNYSTSMKSSVKSVIQKYPKGAEVQVYYDPDDPDNALLQPGTTWMTYLPFGLGLIFLIVGVISLGGFLFSFVFATVTVTGAATGMVGQRKSKDYRSENDPFEDDLAIEDSHSAQNDTDSEDDGFDL